MREQTMLNEKISARVLLLLLTVLVFMVTAQAFAQEPNNPKKANDLTQLSIEDLMNIEIHSTATLTKTAPRLVPAAVTTITAEQIQASGARSLYELLDIYVPNLEWLRHHWEADVLGLRGIINDRNDKFLLLVNGRNMNQRTHFGALSELDLVMLSDIHHIDVVRGPGSALYGPGAVSMVINIVTYSAQTFQGTETTARVGAIEEFYSGEVKHGQKFDDNDGGVFAYAGLAKYNGASLSDAPQIYPYSFPANPGYPGQGTHAGDPMTNAPLGRDGEVGRGQQPIKTYIQITRDNWDIWGRYTRGGKEFALASGALATYPTGWANKDWASSFYSYQQATGWIGYKQELTSNIDIDYAFSYSLFDNEQIRKGIVTDAFREDNYYGKALLQWQLNDQHKIAFGTEISHMELGPCRRDKPGIWFGT
jgi:iron complex outermembrane receptor protein